jgi:predicted dehydrogenase
MSMAAEPPIRVAAVGAGYFSRFQYRAWTRIPEVALVGICNRTLASAKAFAAEFAIPSAFDDLPRMLDGTRPYLLDIITPPETHLAAISAAAARKIDVICQKPFCRTLAEARQSVEIAEAAGISVTIHENFRFQPWHRRIRACLDEGLLGQVYQATFRLRPGDGQGERAYLDRQPYFQTMPRLLVHETAIHLIDTFRYLFGEAESVFAALRRLNPVIAGEDSGLIVMDMKNGVRCLFDGNRLSDHKANNRRLTMGEMLIEGEKGVLTLDGDAGLAFRSHGANGASTIDYDWSDTDFGGDCVYRLQRHVIDNRLGRGAMENSARNYLANIAIEEAVYASDAEGRRIAT